MQVRLVESWISRSTPAGLISQSAGVQAACPVPVREPAPEFSASGNRKLPGEAPPGLSVRFAGTVDEVISNTREPIELPSASARAEIGNHIANSRHILRPVILDLCVQRQPIYRVLYANMLLSFD